MLRSNNIIFWGLALFLFLFMLDGALAFDQNLFCSELDLSFAQCQWAMDYISNESDVAQCPDANVSCTTEQVVVEQCNLSEIEDLVNCSDQCSSYDDLVNEDYNHLVWFMDQRNINFSGVVDLIADPQGNCPICNTSQDCAVEVCPVPDPCPACEDCAKAIDRYRCQQAGGSFNDQSGCSNPSESSNSGQSVNFNPVTGMATADQGSTVPESYSSKRDRNLSTFAFFGVIILISSYVFLKYAKPKFNRWRSKKKFGTESPYDHKPQQPAQPNSSVPAKQSDEGFDPLSVFVDEQSPEDLIDYESAIEDAKSRDKKGVPKRSANSPATSKQVDQKLKNNLMCPRGCGVQMVFDQRHNELYCPKCQFCQSLDEGKKPAKRSVKKR